jgi:DNA polymerase-3 subunit delta'
MQFKDVIGQQELKTHLLQEVDEGKISHAQLFLGKAGYGGLPLALAFVQYLFCEQKNGIDSCGNCPACHKVSQLQHPDLHFSFPTVQALNKKSDGFIKEWREQVHEQPYFGLNEWVRRIDDKERTPIIGTEESQEIIRKLSLKSYEGGFKVMIIWKAEEMNPTCANKLLKILEEPPKDTLFILLCEAQDAMLPTILSRTQIVKIPRVTSDDLNSYLRNLHQNLNSNSDSIVARVDGDVIEALELTGDHQEQDENRQLFIQLMRACYKKDVFAMLDWAEAAAASNKERQKIFLQYALHMFRQSMLRNYTENQLTRVSQEEDQFLTNFARFITGNNIMDFMDMFNNAHYHIDRNANAKILFTNLCFNVMRFIHAA